MTQTLKYLFVIFMSFSGGLVIAGAVFAFIAVIGVVPRLAQKTGTSRYIKLYESAIITGGVLGSSTRFINYYLPVGGFVLAFIGFCIGVFYGCLAVCLAEVLNVLPILSKRAELKRGISAFMLSIAAGKLIGSLLYYMYPFFYMLY